MTDAQVARGLYLLLTLVIAGCARLPTAPRPLGDVVHCARVERVNGHLKCVPAP